MRATCTAHRSSISKALLQNPEGLLLPSRYSLAASTLVSSTTRGFACAQGVSTVTFLVMRHQREVCPLSRRNNIIPLCSITEQPLLVPSSFTRSSIGSPCGSLSPLGELRAYHVPSLYPHGLGLASTPGARPLRPVTLEHRFLAPHLFGPSVTAPSACLTSRRLQPFTCVDLTMQSSLPTTSVLAVVPSAHAPVTIPKDEAPLSQ